MKLIKLGSPPYVKFCPPEFNIKSGCNTVRLGTLFGYRAEENEKLRDTGEGTFSYSVTFPKPTKVSREWFEAFEVESHGNTEIKNLILRDGDIFVETLYLEGSTHNCWIYCLSKSEGSAGNISDTHQDKWVLPKEKMPGFAQYLANLLWNDLRVEDLPEGLTSQFSLQEINQRLSISCEVEDVVYGDRSISVSSEEELPVSEIARLRDNIAFMKPKVFENENEVRLAIWLCFDNKKISIRDKPKIIPLRPIDKII